MHDLVKDTLINNGVEEMFKLSNNMDGEIKLFDNESLAKLGGE